MGNCPYCKNELHLDDFFTISDKETKHGTTTERVFKGDEYVKTGHGYRMWVCPLCDVILGFTEHSYKWR
ncbi:MAG: hypothetical protein ACFFDF_19210 [Candidatus Odinarchaeota archaeon]